LFAGGFVKEKRMYQRYTISEQENKSQATDIQVNGMNVSLVDFSLGGLCVLSEKKYNLEDIVTVMVNLEHSGKIELIGKVVRVIPADRLWSVAVDLSNNYKLKPVRKP
jgi:hypothetical protein